MQNSNPIDQNAADPMISAAGVIKALYEELLQRGADEIGLRMKVQGLVSGKTSIREIIQEMVASEEFGEKLTSFLNSMNGGGRFRLTNDVSEHGEVWQLLRLWVNEQASCGIVVDVGARGRDRSNSFDLMEHFGWRGLLVEANPELHGAIDRDFARCDMQLVSCAVSDFNGRSTFTLGVNDDVSSLSAFASDGWGATRGTVEVEVRRLPDILDEFEIPLDFDLLSLDIEGEDFKVLNDLVANSPYRPNWIVMESAGGEDVRQMLDPRFGKEVRRHYRARAATRSNIILARQSPERANWAKRREAAFQERLKCKSV